MPLKVKLALKDLTDQQIVDKTAAVADALTAHAATFAGPDPAPAALKALGTTLKNLLTQRDALLQQAQALTLKIRNARTAAETGLTNEGTYVESVVESMDDAAAAEAVTSIGMDVAITGGGGSVGAMPKVEGLAATQGDADGEIDLHWNPVRRGLQNYRVESTDAADGLSGWKFALNAGHKSKASTTGLTSGKRYWFRVIAEGSAGPGPASDPATKVAP